MVAQDQKPFEDKLRVCLAFATSIAGQGSPSDAAEFIRGILEKFGCKFPRGKVGFMCKLVKSIVKVKKLSKGGVIHDLDSLPVDDYPFRCKLYDLLDRLVMFLYISGGELLPLVIFKNLDWTLKHGLNDFSGVLLVSG